MLHLFTVMIRIVIACRWGFHRVLDSISQVVREFDVKRVGTIDCSRNDDLVSSIFENCVREVDLIRLLLIDLRCE